jgi:hypothetical protein
VTKGTKLHKILVYCLNVSSDGFPVDVDGEECGVSGKRPLYTWEIQRRSKKWMMAHVGQWKAA